VNPWRKLQWFGVFVVAASAFWPTFEYRLHPLGRVATDVVPSAAPDGRFPLVGPRDVPAETLAAAVRAARIDASWWRPLWRARRWYPWYLAGLWALVLLAVRGRAANGSDRVRVAVGGAVWVLTLGLLAFEAAYLKTEYAPFLPGRWGSAEAVGAWLLVAAILLWRRRVDRRLGAVEAVVGAQALLGFVHGLTLPTTVARCWWDGNDAGQVLQAVWADFPPSFWMGMAGFLLVAVPVYLRREPAACARRAAVDSRA
jgi:hypothetical protein